MTARARGWLVVLVLGLMWPWAAGCRRDAALATAIEAAGSVQRGHGDASTAVVAGTTFVVGDTLRTGAASRARVGLTGGGVIRIGENARLRFQRGAVLGQQGPDLAVELGTAEVDEVTSDLSIVTALGTARLERGARVRVRADGQNAQLEVLVGRAVMLDEGRVVAVEAGHGVRIRLGSRAVQHFSLEIGEAVVEESPVAGDAGPRPAVGGPATAAAPPPAAPSPDAGQRTPAAPAEAGASLHPEGRSGTHAETSRADVTLAAGESATLHDGRSLVAVRLRVDRLCTGDAIVELGVQGSHRERVTGTQAVVLRLTPGRRGYTVRCAADGGRGAPRATGALTLRRDNGFVPLARRAPVVAIDADGRRYTVLFQTRLPQLTLAWPAAPAGGSLSLHVESGSGAHVLPGASPRRPLPAGTVQEGTYVLWYSSADGRFSPKTTVSVRFDNAAPTAQFFRTPAGGNGAITVDGVTVEGAKVSIGDEALAVDGNGRFRAEATPRQGDEAVAVRLEHPRTGVHYYVRRTAGAR